MTCRLVVLGDMIDSRASGERPLLAEEVRGVLRQLADAFSAQLQAPPMTTRGLDEFSGVFRQPEAAFDLLVRINLRLWPNRFRMAAYFGEVDVAPNSGDASQMDGPAFHAAASRIQRMKREGQLFAIDGDQIDPSVAALASALGSAHQSMTASLKRRTVETLEQFYSRLPHEDLPTQDEVATAMGLKSRQAVSDALKRAEFDTLRQMEEAMRQWLGTIRSQAS